MRERLRSTFSRLKPRATGEQLMAQISVVGFVVYILITLVFWRGGYLSGVAYVVVSLIVLAYCFVLMTKPLFLIGAKLDQARSISFSRIISSIIFDLILTILAAKLVLHLMFLRMPRTHYGFICDLFEVMRNGYALLNPQALLNDLLYLVVGSLIIGLLILTFNRGKR